MIDPETRQSLLRAIADTHSAVVLDRSEWTPERVLDVVREKRAREAAEGRADEHMDGHARAIANALIADHGVAPDDLSTTLLAMASHLGTVLVVHGRDSDAMALRLLWIVADEIDRAQHQPGDDTTPEKRCGRCGRVWPCSVATGGR